MPAAASSLQAKKPINQAPLLSENGVEIYVKPITVDQVNEQTGEKEPVTFEVYNIRQKLPSGESLYTTAPMKFGDYSVSPQEVMDIYTKDRTLELIQPKKSKPSEEYAVYVGAVLQEKYKEGRDEPDRRLKYVNGFASYAENSNIRAWIIPENDKSKTSDTKVWRFVGPKENPVELSLSDAYSLRDGVVLERDGLSLRKQGITSKPGRTAGVTFKDLKIRWEALKNDVEASRDEQPSLAKAEVHDQTAIRHR